MTTSTAATVPDQLYNYLPYLSFFADLSVTKKVYTFGHDTGLTVHNFLSTSHQIKNLRTLYQTLINTTPKDIPSTLSYYYELWLHLVHEDPVHVLIETLLLSFLIYMFLMRNKEKYRKKMQDRLTDAEIESLLKEWKERGRVSLTGVPIEEWEEQKKKRGMEDEGDQDGKKRKVMNMKDIIVESMHGSKMVVKVGNNQQQQSQKSLTGKKDKNATKTMTVLNFATFDFLGMSCPETNPGATNLTSSPKTSNAKLSSAAASAATETSKDVVDVIKEASMKALTKYGCGSCGPRGFYGTIDTHLDLENAMASFFNTDSAILYSDGAAASASTVAAFAKRGDLLVVDEGIYEALGTGVILSRANVKYFKHNDMEDLRRVLESIEATDESLNRKKNDQRRFIVVEALYKNYGTICPLDELIKLKEKFCYRLILDESFSFGSIGDTGKGGLEFFNLEPMRHAEIVTFSLENTMGSIGGITVGDEEVVDHQRLSGAGYCFSASLPPFLASAAQASLERMISEPQLISTLRDNIEYFYDQLNIQLSNVIPSKIVVTSQENVSPIVYLQHFKNEDNLLTRDEQVELFDKVAAHCLENGLFVISTGSHVYDHLHKIPPPAIRMTIMAKQSKADIDTAIKILKKATTGIL